VLARFPLDKKICKGSIRSVMGGCGGKGFGFYGGFCGIKLACLFAHLSCCYHCCCATIHSMNRTQFMTGASGSIRNRRDR